MTTTQLFQGIEGDRNSSRVLRPPGGGSSNIFGGGEEAAPVKKKDYYKSDIFNQSEPTTVAANTGKVRQPVGASASPYATDATPVETAEKKPAADATEDSAVAPAAAAPTEEKVPEKQTKPGQSNINPITGEDMSAARQNPTVHTSTRVRQPPGGASSGLW
jgi:hypothetical protein